MKKRFLFWRTMSFKRKLIAYSLLLSIVPVLGLGLFSAYYTLNSIQDEVDRNHQVVLEQTQYQLDQFIKNLEMTAIELASNVSVLKSVEAGPAVDHLEITLDMIETLRRARSFTPTKFNVSIIYKKFDYVYSTLSLSTSFKDSIFEHILKTAQPQFNNSLVVTPPLTRSRDEMLLMRPVPLHTYYTDGILALHIDTEELTGFLEKLSAGNHNQVYVVDEAGTIILSRNKEEIGSKLTSTTDLYNFWRDPQGFTGSLTINRVEYQLTAQKSSTNNWTYIVMTPTSELMQKSDNIKKVTFALIALFIIIWILISFIGSRRLYSPIEKLLHKFSPEQEQKPEDGLQALDFFMHQIVDMNSRLQSRLNEQLPEMKDSASRRLLLGEITASEIRKKKDYLDLTLNGSWFCVCVATVDDYAGFMNTYQERDRALIHYAIRKMMEEICEEKMACMTLTPQSGQVVLIVGLDKPGTAAAEAIREAVDRFRHYVKQYFKFTMSVAISSASNNDYHIQSGYQEALSLLSYRFLMGHDVTISAEEVKPSIEQSGKEITRQIKAIASHVIRRNLPEAEAELDRLIRQIPQYAQSAEAAMGIFSYLIGETEYLMQEMGVEPDRHDEDNLYKRLFHLTTLEEVQHFLKETVFPSVAEQVESLQVSKQKKMVKQVLLYVQENCELDVTLQLAAEHVKTSPSQLSRAFKEETGTAFSDYVLAFRMERAKQWLKETDMPIKEIAERLRYSTVQNFSRTFKQATGQPPGAYRNRRKA